MNTKKERKKERKKKKMLSSSFFLFSYFICRSKHRKEKTLISIKDGINSWVKENSYWRLIVQKDISTDFKGFLLLLR